MESVLCITARTDNYFITEHILRLSKSSSNPFNPRDIDIINWSDSRGQTPLYIATTRGYMDLVDILVYHDASPVKPGINFLILKTVICALISRV